MDMSRETVDLALRKLASVNTPMACNALRMLNSKWREGVSTSQSVIPVHPGNRSFVGFAKTARMQSSSPPSDAADVIAKRRLSYYRYIHDGPSPKVVVMEDCGAVTGYGCIWGDISSSLHRAFGVAGVVTNGAVRDLDDIPEDFQILAGTVRPSGGFAHLIDFDTPVRVFGLEVRPGDLIQGDRHGAVVIPQAAIPDIASAIDLIARREKVVVEAANRADFDYEKFLEVTRIAEEMK